MNLLKLEMKIDDLGLPHDDKTPDIKASELVSNVIKNIMISYSQAQRGLTGEERKQYYAIGAALDKAVAANEAIVELDDSDAGFLRKCKREARMIPGDALQRVEQLIDGMTRS